MLDRVGRVEHIGVAVNNVEEVARFYAEALGVEVSEPEYFASEGVKIVFLPTNSGLIELLEPVSETSAIKKFLDNKGEGMHHVCFEVEDIEEVMSRVAAFGAQLIDQTPRIGRGGKRVAFIHPKSAHGVLVELLENKKGE
jgi:methylmalonyl-CoA epimerase